jgi:membrane dipeptidase
VTIPRQISRRAMLGGAATALAAGGFPMLSFGRYRVSPAAQRSYSRRTVDLVQASTVIDMLGSLKLDDSDGFYTRPLSAKDEADFRASGINCLHDSDGIVGPNAREETLIYLATQQGYAGRNSHLFTLVDKATDITRAKRDGKIALIMGLQNSEHFLEAGDVQLFYDLGQRVSQLTYNTQNFIGSGSTEREDGGVSDFGESIIRAMNAAGMLVDVSHCADRTTLDAIALSAQPVAITHSNCRALNDHPRTKTDEAIKACAAKGGVIGITGVRMFVSAKEPTTLADLVDHIDHVVKLAGIDHVGIGSDSDLNGYDNMSPAVKARMRGAYKASYAIRDKADIDGFGTPLKMFNLTDELIRRKYSDENIRAILGGNFLRLLTTVWGG